MPASKPRRKRARRAATQPAEPDRRAKRRSRKAIGWGMFVVGLVLFLMGQIGARAGIVFLPFDRHHVIEQFGGGILAAIGLILGPGSV